MTSLIQIFGNDAAYGPDSLSGLFTSNGLPVSPARDSIDKEDPSFNGGYTVRRYGGDNRVMNGMSAIQLEFGGSFRTRMALPKTAQSAADAICKFAKAYLLSK